ncbi:MAG: hypothetical protein CMH50_14255 [Myxococcales bacterium]|nr:hypothetical protein [Myxococcales bacterium]|tara:strand:- start:592 stop:1641 length:1050 start_codon:yes stop_codon:yes gene_type:complete
MFKVLYLAKGDRSYPSSRYRIWQFVQPLAEVGVSVDVRPLFDDRWMNRVLQDPSLSRHLVRLGLGAEAVLKRCLGSAHIAAYDLVIVEQELAPLLPFAVEKYLLASARRVVIEMDDAHHLKPGRAGKFKRWFAAADGVICGNEFLASAVQRAGGKPFIVPTVVDVEQYAVKKHSPHQPLRLVWLGLASNLHHLHQHEEAFRQLNSEMELELVVISSEAPHFSGVNIRHEPWSEADESRLVSDCDVGVMPLPDEPWTRGKCGLKLLQYMACGLPSIASPVGVNTQIAQDGGVLLAESHQEWIEGIRRLRDPARRQQMGGDARRSVETRWSLQAWVEQVAELYQRLGVGHA